MKTKTTTLILGIVMILLSCEETKQKLIVPLQEVNPFIGTGGHGHTYPGVSVPFGGVQLSPDTRLKGWDGCGGYHYSDSVIYGFSHTHLSGTGVSDYGDILLMPFIGEPNFNNGYKTSPDSGYASRFSHSSETSEAGFYSVNLSDYDIDVELTSSSKCGFHRYSYNNTSQTRRIILDLEHRDELLDYKIELIEPNIIQGKRISKAWAREQHVYFYIEVRDGFENPIFNKDSTKLIFTPSTQYPPVRVKTGISAVSIEGAKKNMALEIPHWDFDSEKAFCKKLWEKELNGIQVKMNSKTEDKIFYTALYHSYLNPNSFLDADNKYRGTDLKIHTAENHGYYTIFSLWDTYRATHPLFTITQRARTKSFIDTFLKQYKEGGKLPVWELAGNYTGCMIGYHSIPVIVDAYQNGITDFDTELALEAMIATSKANELGKIEYAENGYMASDEEHESVSKNLEYAYDDWCIAQFAKALNKPEIYKEYIIRAQNYKNIFDPETKFMRSKRNQQFQVPFDPTEVNFNFTEANSWQYSFYVPHDIEGLKKLFGGADAMDTKLDSLFSTSNKTTGRTQVDITGLIGQYAHGNEPSHHMAYLYNYVGKPWKTQQMVRRILAEMYSNEPDGLIGNEDCGQMSSWYVLSALGIYPVTPGSGYYDLGSPLVKHATFNLENKKTFEIIAHNQSKENVFVQAIKLNGKPYNKLYLLHKDIIAGGKLEFEMGPIPNKEWKPEQAHSAIEEFQITPVPFVKNSEQVFSDRMEIALDCIDPNAKIYYTLDGSEVSSASAKYQKPFVIDNSVELKAIAISDGLVPSKPIRAEFFKLNTDRKLVSCTPPDPQYAAGGKMGLMDLIRGGDDFRTGSWQGWQGQDVEMIFDLGKAQDVSSIKACLIQDVGSWILMPKSVRYYISSDGKSFKQIAEMSTNVNPRDEGGIVRELGPEMNLKNVQYVKLELDYFGKLPEWHLGAGGEAFIFMDEVLIR